jgi:hypothetical protein
MRAFCSAYPFKAAARVRIPLGIPRSTAPDQVKRRFTRRCWLLPQVPRRTGDAAAWRGCAGMSVSSRSIGSCRRAESGTRSLRLDPAKRRQPMAYVLPDPSINFSQAPPPDDAGAVPTAEDWQRLHDSLLAEYPVLWMKSDTRGRRKRLVWPTVGYTPRSSTETTRANWLWSSPEDSVFRSSSGRGFGLTPINSCEGGGDGNITTIPFRRLGNGGSFITGRMGELRAQG